mmetsp:Transcript_8345/g.18232  ORF Transcript_8345/g.18232 Transcript_8345/m.18232 type:complete len:141 (+) Transcript_8345:138-560(+)
MATASGASADEEAPEREHRKLRGVVGIAVMPTSDGTCGGESSSWPRSNSWSWEGTGSISEGISSTSEARLPDASGESGMSSSSKSSEGCLEVEKPPLRSTKEPVVECLVVRREDDRDLEAKSFLASRSTPSQPDGGGLMM